MIDAVGSTRMRTSASRSSRFARVPSGAAGALPLVVAHGVPNAGLLQVERALGAATRFIGDAVVFKSGADDVALDVDQLEAQGGDVARRNSAGLRVRPRNKVRFPLGVIPPQSLNRGALESRFARPLVEPGENGADGFHARVILSPTAQSGFALPDAPEAQPSHQRTEGGALADQRRRDDAYGRE